MKVNDLNALAAITEARYAQQQQRFAKLLAEEERIRTELSRLEEMDRSARASDAQAIPMRTIGADVIWQGWIGRSRTALNMALARVLAVKEHHLSEVRRAYGKVLVVKEIRDQHITERRKKHDAAALSRAIEGSVRF